MANLQALDEDDGLCATCMGQRSDRGPGPGLATDGATLSPLQPCATERPWEESDAEGGSEQLLLVEDDEALRDSLMEIIEARGIEVRAAADGLEGLHLLRAGFHPKMILLDGWMPKLDGAGVLSAMASDTRLANIPVVWMSADVAEPPPTVAAYLEKPFRVQRLLDVIRSLCGELSILADRHAVATYSP